MTGAYTRRTVLAGLGAAAGVAAGGTAVASSSAAVDAAEDGDAAPGPPTAESLRSFFDERLPRQLEEHDIAGATVSVVADGELRFAKGYGFADVDAERPVEADETPFRIGSVSKSITATAIMRGVESGLVDLETDVRRYVDGLEFPGEHDGRVSLEHLGTHSAGFEAEMLGVFAPSEGSMADLGTTVRSEPPARVRPAGTVASYSNYGVGLAGYALSVAAGRPFAEQVRREVFDPLGMTRSTVRQPPPEELGDALSKGYVARDDGFQSRGFEYVPLRPAGSMSATATDMGRFMLAHLGDGTVDGTQYLSSETVAGMHSARIRNHEAINGVGFGFYELDRGDTRIVGHHGDTQLFHSLLALFPEEGMGLFVSYNTAGATDAREELFDAFIEAFAPPGDPVPARSDGRPTRADELTGWYRGTRVSVTEPDRLLGAQASVEVSVADDGALVTEPVAPGAERQRWVEIEPLVFRAVDGHERLAFRDVDGRITHMVEGPVGVAAFRPLGLEEHPIGQAAGVLGAALVIITGLLAWAGGGIYRRVGDAPAMGQRPRAMRYLAGASGLLLLLAPAGLLGAVMLAPESIIYGLPGWVAGAFAAATLGVLGSLATLGATVQVWRERLWGPVRRLHYTAVAVATALFAWLLWYWNLLLV
jgi:CubicO group peptidase (beta-lactamase class C family)